MDNLKAIETEYNGYKFRSRLEAKWAVFFNNISGLKWEYEPEGFNIDGTYYLPDFLIYVEDTGVFSYIEIKPNHRKDCEKAAALDKALPENHSAYTVSGDPVDMLAQRALCPRCGSPSILEFWENDGCIPCYSCDMTTPQGGFHDLEFGLLGSTFRPHKGYIIAEHLDVFLDRQRLVAKKARQARFEHGRNG